MRCRTGSGSTRKWNELRAAKAAAREELGERVVQLYGRGERIADIARRLGIGYQRAQWILHQHPDWPIMKRSHWTKRTSPERHARIRELHARVWSAEDIAREVGYSASSVYEVIRRAELGMEGGLQESVEDPLARPADSDRQ